MNHRSLGWLLGGLLLLASSCWAGTVNGAFVVKLDGINGICLSSTLSEQANAMVKVTCRGHQFVSIEPRPGRPFIGVHGGAFRFTFSGVLSVGLQQGDSLLGDWLGNGTVTALRVVNLTQRDELLELLVSF